jgi:protein SCO1/2
MNSKLSWGLAPCALFMALATAGCGQDARPHLAGHVPPQERNVGSVSLPEVRPGQPERPFAFRPQPGHVLFVFFGYVSCPDICPTTLSDLRKALKLLGPDASRVDLALVTVDAERDTAEVLAPYVESYVAGGHGLRPATQAELASAERAFGATSAVTRAPNGKIEVSHTADSYLVDDSGRVALVWDYGTGPAYLAGDLRHFLGLRRAGPAPEVEVTNAVINATPPGATAGAAYLTLRSGAGDVLRGVEVPREIAAGAQMHITLTGADGQKTMREVDSLELPAGQAVEFRPGGSHIMLSGLAAPLRSGAHVDMILKFRNAAAKKLRVEVDPD